MRFSHICGSYLHSSCSCFGIGGSCRDWGAMPQGLVGRCQMAGKLASLYHLLEVQMSPGPIHGWAHPRVAVWGGELWQRSQVDKQPCTTCNLISQFKLWNSHVWATVVNTDGSGTHLVFCLSIASLVATQKLCTPHSVSSKNGSWGCPMPWCIQPTYLCLLLVWVEYCRRLAQLDLPSVIAGLSSVCSINVQCHQEAFEAVYPPSPSLAYGGRFAAGIKRRKIGQRHSHAHKILIASVESCVLWCLSASIVRLLEKLPAWIIYNMARGTKCFIFWNPGLWQKV